MISVLTALGAVWLFFLLLLCWAIGHEGGEEPT
jgi:hypothetical protein